jgi:hypothetical protein
VTARLLAGLAAAALLPALLALLPVLHLAPNRLVTGAPVMASDALGAWLWPVVALAALGPALWSRVADGRAQRWPGSPASPPSPCYSSASGPAPPI